MELKFINLTDIIRSYENMEKSMNKLKKCKRKRVFWFEILVKLKNQELRDHFNELYYRTYNRKGSKRMSINRCAYNALRSYYSTTTIAELLDKINYEL